MLFSCMDTISYLSRPTVWEFVRYLNIMAVTTLQAILMPVLQFLNGFSVALDCPSCDEQWHSRQLYLSVLSQ